MENNQIVPRWITVYLWIITIFAFIFSLMAYLKPEIQFGGWPVLNITGALSLAGPLGLYISRNLATAVASLFALLNKSINALMVAFILRAVMDGFDFIHNIMAGNNPIAIFALVAFAIEVLALIKLKKLKV
jgi:hypothetical protein